MLYHGNSVCAGYAIGPVYRYHPFEYDACESYMSEEEIPGVLERLNALRAAAEQELRDIHRRMQERDAEKAKVFLAHIEILEDEALLEELEAAITEENATLSWAISSTFDRFIRLLSKTADPLIRERTADLEDVKLRLLRLDAGLPECNLSALPEPVIVVAHDLLPSDTATIDRENVLAILTETGGPTSHTAIIARSYGIPAILAAEGITALSEHETVIADAVTGTVHTHPSESQLTEFSAKREAFLLQQKAEAHYLPRPCATADGRRIDVGMNIGALNAAEREQIPFCDFAGLFRTEFLYMDSDHLPTEEEQFRAYRAVLEAFDGKPVTLRTLDIGGDKTLPYFPLPKEDNPFLGNRALRLCLTHRGLFLTQLRAALRAALYGDLWLMFPMVGSLEDIRRALRALEEARLSLERDNIPYGACKTGIMIEIPAMALMAKEASELVDFASIGTNDLCQYLSAADRQNPEVEPYYQEALPALLRMISMVISSFGEKPLSVCGEIGGDPRLAPVLAGLGLKKLSMSASRMAAVKCAIAKKNFAELQCIASEVLSMQTAAQIRNYLDTQL